MHDTVVATGFCAAGKQLYERAFSRGDLSHLPDSRIDGGKSRQFSKSRKGKRRRPVETVPVTEDGGSGSSRLPFPTSLFN